MSSMCSPAARWWGRSMSNALGALRRISWSLRASRLTILLNASRWDRRRSIRYGVLERKAVGVEQHPLAELPRMPRGRTFENPLGELRRISLLKLSEKGYEQHSERGFGRYKEAKMGQIVPSRRSVELHHRRVRGFSDSFSRTLGE